MSKKFHLSEESHVKHDMDAAGQNSELTLKSFRYIVATVNEDALMAWIDLWEEFKNGVTPAGVVLPKMEQGFEPLCGWGKFLEKFWLLKHYLDYIQHLCNDQNSTHSE